ncbi:MAG: DoxX family protein [Candidatus Udaeobacter sp.]
MAKVGLAEWWITTLGILKTVGALGLLIGIGVPVVGIAAATGLGLFFIGAIITHLRGHDYSFGPAIVFPRNRRAGGASGFKLKKAI